MTEAEAWREVARIFIEADSDGGLCWEVDMLEEAGAISPELAGTMSRRVREYVDHPGFAYCQRGSVFCNAREDEARCLAALWLAEEAESE